MKTLTPEQDAALDNLINDAADTALKVVLIGTDDATDVDAIAAKIKTAVDNAVTKNTSVPDPATVVVSGLKTTEDALTLAGKPTLVADVEVAENLVANFENNGGHAIAAGIKTFFQKVFGKKPAA